MSSEVQVTGLGEDAEDDVEWLLQKLREVGLQECKQTGVELPRESHYSKPCSTVYIRSPQNAKKPLDHRRSKAAAGEAEPLRGWAPKRKHSLPPAASTTAAGLQPAKARLPSDSKLRWWAL